MPLKRYTALPEVLRRDTETMANRVTCCFLAEFLACAPDPLVILLLIGELLIELTTSLPSPREILFGDELHSTNMGAKFAPMDYTTPSTLL